MLSYDLFVCLYLWVSLSYNSFSSSFSVTLLVNPFVENQKKFSNVPNKLHCNFSFFCDWILIYERLYKVWNNANFTFYNSHLNSIFFFIGIPLNNIVCVKLIIIILIPINVIFDKRLMIFKAKKRSIYLGRETIFPILFILVLIFLNFWFI